MNWVHPREDTWTDTSKDLPGLPKIPYLSYLSIVIHGPIQIIEEMRLQDIKYHISCLRLL